MTVANLFAQHRAGKVSKEKFLYEVRRDAQLPYISNLTSYSDAIKILKQKGVIREAAEMAEAESTWSKYNLDRRSIMDAPKKDVEAFLKDATREEIIGWLKWNDRHGQHTDEDRAAEGAAPLSKEDAAEIMMDMLDAGGGLKEKYVKENSDYEPIQRREPVDFVDDTDDFDTDYLEFTDGDTVVSLHKEDGKWKEGSVIEGEKPYGWGSKTYMSYLTPKQIASYLSKDYGGKWTSYEGLEEADEPAQASEEIKNNINELLRLQEQLDAATAAYEKSIESLVSRKDALVKSVFDSEDVKKVEGAKELKILVDGLVAVVTNPSTRKNLSYKTFSELLEAELKRVAPELTDTINDLREGSKELSTVKGKLAIGGKKIYEEEADDLMSSIKRSKLAVAHAIKAFRRQSVKEAKFGVYIPNGTKKGTKLDIAVEYKNQPGAKKYFDVEFISDKDGKYTFNTKEGEIKIPHADLVTYRKSSQKQEGLNESKKIIKEQEDLYHQIDRLNPILVKKAVNMELAKLPMIDAGVYQKITEKVVKKLQKDPRAYDEVLVSNAKEIHKVDEKLKMTQVKSELKDPHNQMKSPKGLEKPKTNVKASKTENKKGNPKGVKEMKGSKKGHGGIKQMENPGTKETVLESLLSFMFKKKLNEDTHHEYTEGKKVKTPKGEGVIEGLIGDTATVAYENGVKEDIQINALRHYEEEANKPVEEKTLEVKTHEPTMDEKKDKVIQKVLEFLRKKKMKDESIDIETSNPMNPGSREIQMAQNYQRRGLNAKFVKPVPGAPKQM